MNPWLMSGPDDRSYIELFWEYLESAIDQVLADPESWAAAGDPGR